MKCGQTSCTERRKAFGTELSSRLMSGPTRANRVPTISPGTTSSNEATALRTTRIAFRHEQATPGQGPQHLEDGLGRLVALDRADQALEHAGIEGQPEGGGGEEDRPDDRPDPEVVDGDLGVEGALNRIEAEDDESGDDDPGGLHPGGPPGHPDEVQRVELVRGALSAAASAARAPPLPCRRRSSALRWRRSRSARRSGLAGHTASGRTARVIPGRARRPTNSKRTLVGVERGSSPHPGGGGPTAMTVPVGGLESQLGEPGGGEVGPDGRRVRSGGRRCRVHTTWPPGTQNPGIAWMVRVMSAALMFPNIAAHQHDVGRHGAGVRIGVGAGQRGVPLDDPDPLGHPGAGRGGTVPGEGRQGRIELHQQRRDLRTPRMGRHHVDDVTPLARTQAHDPDGLWIGIQAGSDRRGLGPGLLPGPTGTAGGCSSSAAPTIDCTARNRSDSPTTDPRTPRATAPSATPPGPAPRPGSTPASWMVPGHHDRPS